MSMTIGKVANLAGVGVETVRFYQRKGLLEEPPRRLRGFRQYSPETVDRIRFIRQAKALGFTLTEINELLALRVDPTTTCQDVRRHVQEKLGDVDAKIQALSQIRDALLRLTKVCKGRGPVDDCPILRYLNVVENGEL